MSHIQSAYDKLAGIEAGADVTATAGAIMDSDIAAADGKIIKTGAGAYAALPSKWAESGDPNPATDDITLGFVPGSEWLNTTSKEAFICLDNTDGAAVWKSTTAQGAGLNDIVDDTSPQLGAMLDVNTFALGDGTLKILDFVEDASAVNYFEMEHEAAASSPIFRGTGTDTDVGIVFQGKGVSVFDFEGGVITPLRTETGATYQIVLSDHSILSDATAQAQVVSLPPIPAAGWECVVKKIDGDLNTTEVDTPDAATIDGLASVFLLEDDALIFRSNATNWFRF